MDLADLMREDIFLVAGTVVCRVELLVPFLPLPHTSVCTTIRSGGLEPPLI